MSDLGKRFCSVEIRMAANGYLVGPLDPSRIQTWQEFHVFETFNAMVKWLRENLKEFK